jgi:nitrite reductase/ring-hydroxylating ferredoxin subunit
MSQNDNNDLSLNQGRALPRRWRSQFPLHWDADDQVSRRELLRFTVLTSGALFGGTSLLAVLDWFGTTTRGSSQTVVAANQVPEGSAYYFNYPASDDQAVLLHLPGGQFVAYSQKCTHLSCSVYYKPERKQLVCPCHDGVFDQTTGEPVAGPPERPLPRIKIRQENGIIIAEEESA